MLVMSKLIELNLRFAGADAMLITSMALDVDIAELLVKLAIGEPVELPQNQGRYATMQYLLAPRRLARLDSLTFPDNVDFCRVMKPLGQVLASTDNQIDHVGAFLLCADSYPALLDGIRTARRQVEVNGKPLADGINNRVILR